MDYASDYEKELLELIKEYDKEEYNRLMNAPKMIVVDHLDWLQEQFPTLEQFEEEYCKKLGEMTEDETQNGPDDGITECCTGCPNEPKETKSKS